MIFFLFEMLANKRYKSCYKLSLVDAEIMEIANGGENWTRIYDKILLPWLSARWRCKFY